jgi:two-component sensor histidine kinase
MLRLVVSDNGIGLPAGFDLDSSRSMGLQLIRTLSIQLEGFLDFGNGPGMSISILFPREPASVAGPINQLSISTPYT